MKAGILNIDTSKLESINLSLDLITLSFIVKTVIYDIVSTEGDYNLLNQVNPLTQVTILDDHLDEILNYYLENNNVGIDVTGAFLSNPDTYTELYNLYCTLYTELFSNNDFQHMVLMVEEFNTQASVLEVELAPNGIAYGIKLNIPVLSMTL